MQKLAIIFGSATIALLLTITPLLAQEETAPEAPAPATAETTTADDYRGIIPAGERIEKVEDCDKKTDLGEKIQCGTVTLNDVPVLIIHLIQWILTLAGSIAVIMIMVGAFQYMLGGVTDDKERGKKTIIYAIGGLIVAFMAWWIVELIQVWITS